MRFIVHTRNRRRFNKLSEAIKFAAAYFKRTGNVVAITEEASNVRR